MAIDNRVRLTVDLGTEHMAQHLAGSNTGGGYGHLNDRYTVVSIHPPYTQILLKNREFVCREGKAVVLTPSTGHNKSFASCQLKCERKPNGL